MGALTARVPVILTVGALVVNIMLSGRLVEGLQRRRGVVGCTITEAGYVFTCESRRCSYI
jgi:Na+-driven multidrug efflux pump